MTHDTDGVDPKEFFHELYVRSQDLSKGKGDYVIEAPDFEVLRNIVKRKIKPINPCDIMDKILMEEKLSKTSDGMPFFRTVINT